MSAPEAGAGTLIRWQRLRIVAGSRPGLWLSSSRYVFPEGSSSVLSKALAAGGVMASAGSMITTFARPAM